MKQISTFVLALVASMCSLTTWAEEREAPTMPAGVTPESGQTYYVFNTDAELFLSDYNAINAEGAAVQVTITDGRGTQFKIGSNYIYAWSDGRMSWASSSTASETYWTISEVDDGMSLIQCSPYNYYYNEAEYLGVKSVSTTLVHNCSLENNVHWKFFTTEDGQRYRAELRLYKALNAIESYGIGWYIENYKALYDDRANQTSADLQAAAIALEKSTGMSAGYQAPWWNELPILFYTADGNFGQDSYYTWALPHLSNGNYTNGNYFNRYLRNSGETSSISATVLVEEPSTLIYSLSDNPPTLYVYVDDVLVRSFGDEQCNHYPDGSTYTRFFEELSPGLHKITWTVVATTWKGSASVQLRNVGVMSSPLISVSLLEPGSLGTEVWYNTNHLKNVRRLKVKGAMNSEDWDKIKMMSTLLDLDLSEAQFTEIPDYQFRINYNDTTMNFLHKVSLPEGLKKINREAFYNSFVEEINFPSTLQSIGYRAFYMSHILEAVLPDNLTEMGDNVFGRSYWLKKAYFGKNPTTIPNHTFQGCYYLSDVVLPEKLKTVNEYGFHECRRLQTTLPEGLETVKMRAFEGCYNFYPKLPKSLKTICEAAFNSCNAMDTLIVPSSVTTIEEYAFCNCGNLKYVELSPEQYIIPKGIFDNTPKLEVIRLNSPTVVVPTIDGSVYPHKNIAQVTLQVPHYLLSNYNIHSYWYNAAAIEPFDYSTIDFIPLHGNLTLNHERFGGQPSITIYSGNYLKINGDSEQKFNEIWIGVQGGTDVRGQLLNNCDNVTAIGDNKVSYRTGAKKWYFISLPFDLDMTRITHDAAGTQYAIRYYDGAGRATNGKSGNWKNVDRTSILPAGTGFIYQTNIDTYTYFYAADTENKYGTLRNTEFIKTLEVNASETPSNKGWNLVGNPYQCYYNNHCLNFTAPITVWNPERSTYTAYSLTDDDYAIRPNEAFFVQCPNEEYNTIGFPLQGRQLTSVIESQNAVKAQMPEAQTRKVINLTVSNGEMEDVTRVVLNENASLAYETACDASKFMSMDGSVPQIYTLDAEGTQYAINERPVGEGIIALGFYAGRAGDYTIALTRCDAEKIFITDNQTGETTEITNGAYTFSAGAGTDNTRFTLSFLSNTATAINEIDKVASDDKTDVYSVDGKFLGSDASRLGAGVYVLRQGKKISKVIVR